MVAFQATFYYPRQVFRSHIIFHIPLTLARYETLDREDTFCFESVESEKRLGREDRLINRQLLFPDRINMRFARQNIDTVKNPLLFFNTFFHLVYCTENCEL